MSANSNSVSNKFGFEGKELQDYDISDNSLESHNFDARNYDASLGRWINPDPLANFAPELSHIGYRYAVNNPIFSMNLSVYGNLLKIPMIIGMYTIA